jgi:tetratricopeptide (TPR) repeat protein
MSQPQLDLAAELAAAQAAVRARRHAAAVEHLAHLVPVVPTHPAVVAVLDDLVATAPDPLGLVKSGAALTFGQAAVHAYALGKAGRPAEAYQLLRQLVQQNPAGDLIDWALPWLDAGGLAPDARGDAAVRFIVSAHHRFSSPGALSPEATALIRRWLPHVRRHLASRPATDPLQGPYTILLRQAGELDEAVKVARARHAKGPCYESAVSLAANLRARRSFAEWYAACQECLRLRPNDVATRLDLGDCFWEEQLKLEEAEHWYGEALRLEADHAWARPSLLAVQYLRTHEPRRRDELEDHVAAHPDNRRAYHALARITPFFTFFVPPSDATVNLLNQLADRIEAGTGGEVSGAIRQVTTGLEVPSCRRSIDRQLEVWGGKVQIEREVRGMQTPDPRQPRVPVRHRLWEYDGLTPRPAVAPPPANVAEAVAALAATRYDLMEWLHHAGNLAGRLGPGAVPGLLGAMAHPPEPPAPVRRWDWTFRVQVAAAVMIAQSEDRWEGSLRRQVLFDLANGPMDWATVAAAVALTGVALRNPGTAGDVGRLFDEVRRALPRPGHEWYENNLLNLHLRLPGLAPSVRTALRAARADLEARSARRETDAQLAARMFLARSVPEGAEQSDLARTLIEGFARGLTRDQPHFPLMLDTFLKLAESALEGATGETRPYLEEQVRVLQLIRAEVGKGPAPAPAAR